MARPVRPGRADEIVYDGRRWRLLAALRELAEALMKAVAGLGAEPIVHGSVARGDVNKGSDVDIFLPEPLPPYRVELALERAGFKFWKRELVMATPWQLPKAHIYVDERCSVTLPLIRPRALELGFYRFGGALNLEGVKSGRRVPGVDKRLVLIEPTARGHRESSVIGREAEVARIVGVDLDVVRERVHVLGRRAEIGRTGLFIRRELSPDESFEEVFRAEVLTNPAARVRLKGYEP
jgi:hypothetical protein